LIIEKTNKMSKLKEALGELNEKIKKLQQVGFDHASVLKPLAELQSNAVQQKLQPQSQSHSNSSQMLPIFAADEPLVRALETRYRVAVHAMNEVQACSLSCARKALGESGKKKRANLDSDSTLLRAKKRQRTLTSVRAGLNAGCKVAARTPSTASTPAVWILAKVLRYHADQDRYEVVDEEADEADPNALKYYLLPAKCVLPLPASSTPDAPVPLRKDDHVLAKFPNTTSFYPAVVVRPCPRDNSAMVTFADDEDETGRTPQRRVADIDCIVVPANDADRRAQHNAPFGKQLLAPEPSS
jgi:SGF29 tudor-like domain